jgi:hypothetical protein
MTDPTLLASLEGQQYLVLRPTGPVAEFYDNEQASLRRHLVGPISFPNTGHVTLRGFYEPTRVHALRDQLQAWAATQPPVNMRIEAVDGFPTPFQILIARLERSLVLVDAYNSLSHAMDSTDFRRIGELPIDEWIFHLSLIYCSTLSEEQWRAVLARSRRNLATPPSELVTQAEFVWYENGEEHSETVPFGRPLN